MIDLDHRLVVVGGLVLSCLFYQVPIYTICFVIGCGFAVYVRNKYNDGWRFALFGANAFGFIRHTKHGRYRQTTTTPFSTPIQTSEQDPKGHRNEESSSNSPFGSFSRRSSPNFSLNPTPRCRLDQKNYDISPRFLNQNPTFHSRLLTPSFPSDMGRPRHRTSVYDVPNINIQGRMDSTYVGTDETQKPKYSGVGIYPIVQLEPHRPALLSHCNSTMVKNRVTVKVALPERQNYNQSLNRSSPKVSFSSPSLQRECSTVVEALNTRKRSLKDDGTSHTEHSATKRRHHQSENDPSVPHLPSEIAQHFESQLSDESLAILSQPMETTIESPDETLPSTVRRAKTNAIHSSYSSSVRYERSNMKTAKRKPESICDEIPDVKFGRSDSPIRKETSTSDQDESVEVDKSEASTSDDVSKVAPPDSEEKLTSYSFHATMTGARNPMPVHVPTYIPSMEDYHEDKKAERERLQKILGRFTVVNTNEKKEELSSVPTSTNADSNFQITPATVPIVTITQSDNLNDVPSVVETTSASSTSLPTSNLFVASTTGHGNDSITVSEAPPINSPFVTTTVVDKQISDSPFNNSITSSFTTSDQQQTASSANKDSITLTYTSYNPLGITTQPSVSVTSTLTASPFATPSVTASSFATSSQVATPFATPIVTASPFATPSITASPFATPSVTASPFATPSQTGAPFATPGTTSFSFGTVSQNTSSVVPSLQFKAPEPIEQQKIPNSPFTFGLKPQSSNLVANVETTKPSSIGTGGFSFSNAVSTAVSTPSGPSLFSNVSSPFGSNQIVPTMITATTSANSNLNNVIQSSSSGGSGNKIGSTFGGGGFTFGQNFNPPKTEPSTNGGQLNTSSAFQFGSSSLQNSNSFGNATRTTTSMSVPTFGTVSTAFGSNVATNGTNVNGETTNGGSFAQPFSFGGTPQRNPSNSGLFAFGGATPSSNNNNNSGSFGVPSATQGFDFSSASKPSFNFGSSPAQLSGTSTSIPNSNMFSVSPSNTASTRRSKHPPQRHRFHR